MVPGAEARGLVAPRIAVTELASSEFYVNCKVVLTAASLDDVTALPDHSDNGTAQHVLSKTVRTATTV